MQLPYDKDKIRQLRLLRGLSQVAVAKIAGVRQPTISSIETRGEPEVKQTTLQGIAKALGVPLQEILVPIKGPSGERDALDQASALCVALKPRDRAAWIAAGKALLEQSKGEK